MLDTHVIRTIGTLRKFGFALVESPEVASCTVNERQVHAMQASASLLFDVSIEAFSEEGNWAPVKQYVQAEGLGQMSAPEGKRRGLDAIGVAAVNRALLLAQSLLELTQRN